MKAPNLSNKKTIEMTEEIYIKHKERISNLTPFQLALISVEVLEYLEIERNTK